jgi:hypothetical protein
MAQELCRLRPRLANCDHPPEIRKVDARHEIWPCRRTSTDSTTFRNDRRHDWKFFQIVRPQSEDHRVFRRIRILRGLRRPPGIEAGLAAKNRPNAGNGGVSMDVDGTGFAAGTDVNAGVRHRLTHFLKSARSVCSLLRQASVRSGVSRTFPYSPRRSGAIGVVASMIILCAIPFG